MKWGDGGRRRLRCESRGCSRKEHWQCRKAEFIALAPHGAEQRHFTAMILWFLNLLRGKEVDLPLLVLYCLMMLPSLAGMKVSLFSTWKSKRNSYMASIASFIPAFSAALLFYPIHDAEDEGLLTLGLALCAINLVLMLWTLTILKAQDKGQPTVPSHPIRYGVIVAAAALAWVVRGLV